MGDRGRGQAAEYERAEREPARPAAAPVEHREAEHPLRRLQESAGNEALVNLLGAQRNMQVGASNHPAEREADEVAHRVVEVLASGPTGDATRTGAEVTASSGGLARMVRRLGRVGAKGGEIDDETQGLLDTARGGGASLDPGVRRQMESAFGADFGKVRVHDGPAADELNQRMQARAFTVGHDIFFSDGQLDTGRRDGQELLAHELTHVVQQGGAADIGREVAREAEAAPAPGAAPASVEEEAEVPKLSGSISAIAEPTPMETAAADGPVAHRGPGTAPAAPARSAATDVPLSVSLGTTTNVKRDDAAAAKDGANDGLALASPGFTTATSNTYPAGAFGAALPTLAASGLTWAYGTGPTDPISINLTLDFTAAWGVANGGKIDVPSATSPVVTADTYERIAADLEPVLENGEKSWRAPRSRYWSEAICARHEKYHCADFSTWSGGVGKDLFTNTLNAKAVTLTPEERLVAPTVTAKIGAAVTDTLATVGIARWQYYTGGQTSYLSYGGEVRAFGDGKAPYQALAAGVRAQGTKLAQARDEKNHIDGLMNLANEEDDAADDGTRR